MYQLILLVHVFAAVFIIALVLVQQGKGATVGAAFGSGASQTVFGSRGSGSFLFRLTIGLTFIFFITSIGLNYIATHAMKQEKTFSIPAEVTQTPTNSTINTQQTLPAPGLDLSGKVQPSTDSTAMPGNIPTRK